MKEIYEAIAREELGVFTVDVDVDEPESDNEDDQEEPNNTKKEEIENDSEAKDNEDNPKAEENEVSDSDSTSTVEFTASELNERAKHLEPEDEANKILEIVTEDEEHEEDAIEATAPGKDSHSLELMKASECKRRYENLRDDCNAEQFIDVAHKTAMSIRLRGCPRTRAHA